MKCIKCYKEINDNLKFCTECGAKQPADRAAYEMEHPELAFAVPESDVPDIIETPVIEEQPVAQSVPAVTNVATQFDDDSAVVDVNAVDSQEQNLQQEVPSPAPQIPNIPPVPANLPPIPAGMPPIPAGMPPIPKAGPKQLCSRCGSTVPQGARFCLHCGQQIG